MNEDRPMTARLSDRVRRKAITKLVFLLYTDDALASFGKWEMSVGLAISQIEKLEVAICLADMELDRENPVNRQTRMPRT